MLSFRLPGSRDVYARINHIVEFRPSLAAQLLILVRHNVLNARIVIRDGFWVGVERRGIGHSLSAAAARYDAVLVGISVCANSDREPPGRILCNLGLTPRNPVHIDLRVQ